MALERVADGLPERPALMQSVRSHFIAHDFAALEKMAGAARNGARFTDGCWQLPMFYRAFILKAETPETVWNAWLRLFDQWDKAVPGSITARLARAEAWSGRASPRQLEPEQAARINDDLAEMRGILEASPAAKSCPGWYQMMMWVARAQNCTKEEFERLFAAAVALAPDYETFYFDKASWIATHPNEYGGEHAWAAFAEESRALTSPALGSGMYARIVWSMLDKSPAEEAMENARLNTKEGVLKSHGVDWETMKRGFEDLERLYPGSMWNKNAFCFYAFCGNDRATTTRLLAELHDRFAPGIWPAEEYYSQVKEWARAGGVP